MLLVVKLRVRSSPSSVKLQMNKVFGYRACHSWPHADLPTQPPSTDTAQPTNTSAACSAVDSPHNIDRTGVYTLSLVYWCKYTVYNRCQHHWLL